MIPRGVYGKGMGGLCPSHVVIEGEHPKRRPGRMWLDRIEMDLWKLALRGEDVEDA
jgi:hypothetical protein